MCKRKKRKRKKYGNKPKGWPEITYFAVIEYSIAPPFQKI